MKLTEPEMRMAYQLESTCRAAILNEIAMTLRYAPNKEIKATAESLLSKLQLLSDEISFAIDCSLIKYIVTNCDISTFKV